jgi:hypothetical protein
VPAVVGTRATVRKDEIDSLRTVHRTSAAQPDEQLRIVTPSHRNAGFNVLGRWVLVDSIEDVGFDPGPLECGHAMRRMTRRDNARIAHHQRPPRPQLAGQLTERLDLARTEHDPGAGMKIEGNHVMGNRPGGSRRSCSEKGGTFVDSNVPAAANQPPRKAKAAKGTEFAARPSEARLWQDESHESTSGETPVRRRPDIALP